jgi:hypothetical protein
VLLFAVLHSSSLLEDDLRPQPEVAFIDGAADGTCARDLSETVRAPNIPRRIEDRTRNIAFRITEVRSVGHVEGFQAQLKRKMLRQVEKS